MCYGVVNAVPVRIVDPSKDLNSYGLGSVDWKERVEGWKLKQDKNMMQMTNKYTDGKGDIEGTGSNGEDLQMYDPTNPCFNSFVSLSCFCPAFAIRFTYMPDFMVKKKSYLMNLKFDRIQYVLVLLSWSLDEPY